MTPPGSVAVEIRADTPRRHHVRLGREEEGSEGTESIQRANKQKAELRELQPQLSYWVKKVQNKNLFQLKMKLPP